MVFDVGKKWKRWEWRRRNWGEGGGVVGGGGREEEDGVEKGEGGEGSVAFGR